MTAATKVQWRVQVRLEGSKRWLNKGLYETREAARERAKVYREHFTTERDTGHEYEPFGFGNTRIRRYVKGEK